MGKIGILRQKKWTQAQLVAEGFKYYRPQKQLVMARRLPKSEAPKVIPSQHDRLVAEAGHIICYAPSKTPKSTIDLYHHWPVAPKIFRKSYRPWDEAKWQPNASEAQLIEYGCKPFYKAIGVWAKRFKEQVYLQSMESPKPVEVSPGTWVCIGLRGEPYACGDNFEQRYIVPKKLFSKGVIGAIISKLKG